MRSMVVYLFLQYKIYYYYEPISQLASQTLHLQQLSEELLWQRYLIESESRLHSLFSVETTEMS